MEEGLEEEAQAAVAPLGAGTCRAEGAELGDVSFWFARATVFLSPNLGSKIPLLLLFIFLIFYLGTSLVAQWLRIRLPLQGTQVRALVWEDPTCHRATKPVCHNY